MSSTEPLGVALVEIEPVAAGFRAKTEAQIRSQLAGVGAAIPAVSGAAAAQGRLATATEGMAVAASQGTRAQAALTDAEVIGTRAAIGKSEAETAAAAAARLHAQAAMHAQQAVLAQSASIAGLRGASLGLHPAFVAATAGVIGLFKSLERADEFQQSMNELRVATRATGDEMDAARATAIALGRDLGVPLTTANEAAEALNLLSRSGFSLDESLRAARGALLLTAASGEELGTSVQHIDRLLDSFNLTAEDSVRVADSIAVGMKFTTGSATEFAQALSSIGPAADALGLSLEDAATLILQLAESGLSATQGSGLLRQSFLRLAAGGKQVNEGLARVGLTLSDLRDELGNIRPDVFVRLSEALKNVNRAQQLQILTQIFSRRSALAVIRLVDQQRAGYQRMRSELEETGAAQDEASARAANFSGQLQELGDDVGDLGLKLGRVSQGPATLFVKAMRDIARQADRALTVIDLLGGGVVNLGQDFVNAVPQAQGFLNVLLKFVELQRDPVGGFFDFAKGIPGEIKEFSSGLQQAVAQNVPGIADIPGIEGFSKNLGILVGGFEKGAADIKISTDKMSADTADAVNNMENSLRAGAPRIASAASQIALGIAQAQAAGDIGGELAGLRQQEARQEAFIARQEKLPQTKARVATLIKANQNLAATRARIASLLAEQESIVKGEAADAKAAADEIVKAANERDRNFIAAIEAQVGNREAAVGIAAASDDTLRDDITANIKLRNTLTASIAATRARIREVRAAGRSAEDLVAELAILRRARNSVRRAIDQLRADEAELARTTRIESAQLDLQILEARVGSDPTAGQTRALISAHNRVIAALKRAQNLTRRRSIEWKRLQLDIENELAAIRDLKSAQSDAAGETKDFSQQAFAFLQELHGFSSNLASNILPTGSTIGGGSVFSGAPSTSTTAPAPFARPQGPSDRVPSPFEHGRGRGDTSTNAAALREQRGGPATFGQMEKLLHVTQNTNAILRDLRRGVGHPEAHHTRRQGRHPTETGVD